MTIYSFPPREPPLPLSRFTKPLSTTRAPFNPGIVNSLIRKHAAGLRIKPTAEQLRHWMNSESDIPAEYHEAICDTMAKMYGYQLLRFSQNNGASIRGFAHLIHQTGAYTDRIVHYIDNFSDIGDPRPRWDGGYAGSQYCF